MKKEIINKRYIKMRDYISWDNIEDNKKNMIVKDLNDRAIKRLGFVEMKNSIKNKVEDATKEI